MVGGSSRNLLVRDELINMFGRDKLAKSLQGEIDPDELVAKGAAKYAKILDEQKEDYHLSDIVPIALRVDLYNVNTREMVSYVVIKRFDSQPAKGSIKAVISDDLSEDNPLRLYVRQGNNDEHRTKNIAIGVPKFKGDFYEGEKVTIIFEFDTDGLLDITIEKADGTLIKSDGIDMSKTPKDIEEVIEEGAENQLTKILQAIGMQSQEIVEVLGKIAKGQEEVRELLNEVLKNNELTRAEIIKEVKELLAELPAKSTDTN